MKKIECLKTYELIREHRNKSHFWVCRSDDLQSGNKVSACILDHGKDVKELKAIENYTDFKSKTGLEHAVIVNHKSQIDYIYTVKGRSKNQSIKFRDQDTGLLENGFSKECNSNMLRSNSSGLTTMCGKIHIPVSAQQSPDVTSDEIIGKIDVFPVRENGPNVKSLNYSIEFDD